MATATNETTPGSIKNSRMSLMPTNSRFSASARSKAIAVLPGIIISAYLTEFHREVHRIGSWNISIKFWNPTNLGEESRSQSVKARRKDAKMGKIVKTSSPVRLGARKNIA
jgi:hypothetical protein